MKRLDLVVNQENATHVLTWGMRRTATIHVSCCPSRDTGSPWYFGSEQDAQAFKDANGLHQGQPDREIAGYSIWFANVNPVSEPRRVLQ